MKVFMTGATGLIGRSIRHALTDRGDEVIALTRSPRPPAAGTQWIVAPPTNVSDWGEHVDGCNAVINLAGEPIAQRWSASAMTRIVQSRVGVTTALFHAIEGAKRRPAVMLSASAVGFYGSSESETFTEESPQGHGFLARVCEQWEDAAERSAPLTRVVRTRFGIVFTRHGGALPKLLAPYRMMMGGPLGSGKQWMSWVSLEDTVQMLLHALDESKIEGAFNVTAPEPERNSEVSSTIAKVLRVPNLMGANRLWLKMFLGKMAQETILEGQKVLPEVAKLSGYTFQHPKLEGALRGMFGK